MRGLAAQIRGLQSRLVRGGNVFVGTRFNGAMELCADIRETMSEPTQAGLNYMARPLASSFFSNEQFKIPINRLSRKCGYRF
jgi:hypothetical protein